MVGIYIVKNSTNDKPQTIFKNQQNDVVPGTNKVVLILANSKKINLNDVANGQLARQAGISIQKTNTGQMLTQLTLIQTDSATPTTLPAWLNVWLYPFCLLNPACFTIPSVAANRIRTTL